MTYYLSLSILNTNQHFDSENSTYFAIVLHLLIRNTTAVGILLIVFFYYITSERFLLLFVIDNVNVALVSLRYCIEWGEIVFACL